MVIGTSAANVDHVSLHFTASLDQVGAKVYEDGKLLVSPCNNYKVVKTCVGG